MSGISNHDLANRYEAKQRLIGKRILDFELMDNDRVVLKSVLDTENTGRLVIPRFITDININLKNNEDIRYSALCGCRYSEVYVDNKEGVEFSAIGLCCGMNSVSLKVEFNDSSSVIDMSDMFNGCSKLVELDISKIDMCNVKNMRSMFKNCENLEYIDMSKHDLRKVEDISWMVSDCYSLKGVKLGELKVNNIVGAFSECYNLESVDISKVDTSEVKDMSYLFTNSGLKVIDIKNLDTSNVIDMSYMFAGCDELEVIAIESLDMRNVKYLDGMFEECSKLKELDLSRIVVSKRMNIRQIMHKLELQGLVIKDIHSDKFMDIF